MGLGYHRGSHQSRGSWPLVCVFLWAAVAGGDGLSSSKTSYVVGIDVHDPSLNFSQTVRRYPASPPSCPFGLFSTRADPPYSIRAAPPLLARSSCVEPLLSRMGFRDPFDTTDHSSRLC